MGKRRHLSVRVDADMLEKFYFVSKYNGRSGNGQILFLIRFLVEKFEKEHGRISEEELSRGRSGE